MGALHFGEQHVSQYPLAGTRVAALQWRQLPRPGAECSALPASGHDQNQLGTTFQRVWARQGKMLRKCVALSSWQQSFLWVRAAWTKMSDMLMHNESELFWQ